MRCIIISGFLMIIHFGSISCVSKNEKKENPEILPSQDRAPRIPGKESIKYSEVYHVEGRFAAWPANNGIWHFEDNDQVMVGFTSGAYNKDAKGHKISDTGRESYLATSIDGGATWNLWRPENYVGSEAPKTPLENPIDFTNPGFAMRVSGAAYHGNEDPEGRFYYSYDKGQTWNGPYPLGNIHQHEELKGKIITARTDYIVLGKHECLVMISAKPGDDLKGESGPMTDKVLCIKTTDGGKSFEFMSWIVPLSDPYRAVMPNTVKVGENHLVTVLRRKTLDTEKCWIDAYASTDGGNTWKFLSRVTETGVMNNGNPPSIALLKDGSLCTVYGNRDKRMVLGKYSVDYGLTWGEEFVVRQNDDNYMDADLGYPRLTCLNDGSLVAIYYWVSKDSPVQYVESARWKP